ncbi:MAG TPA: ABC transporter permease [Vicinamibacterales bacterium]|nr:ABC transporter permease [Vicinamibacterales bacterium]
MTARFDLFKEVVVMAFDTVRTNKMRSGLTVLGIVIGITAIVGMTALIRGFDKSMRDLFATIGPNTIFIQRFGITDFANGADARELLKRPNLTVSDARAISQQATTLDYVDLELGAGVGPRQQERVFYKNLKTRPVLVLGTSEFFAEGTRIPFKTGRFFNGTELQFRKNVVVLAYGPYQRLFEETGIDPIGKTVRIGANRYEVVGAFDKRPTPGGFNSNADDFVVIPHTTYQRVYGMKVVRIGNLGSLSNIQISVVPKDGYTADDAMREVQNIMRARHGLKLDQPDDFDLFTQDSILKLYERISQAILFALVVISSIALMVGGIGVMAIMSISVTERTREIGVRKALGARRAEILFQFLMEAAFLTSLGGILGIALGSALGGIVHLVSGFPVSLPWWSFAIGLGFSASVGIFFGMYPAFKASRLDPIEALRYE